MVPTLIFSPMLFKGRRIIGIPKAASKIRQCGEQTHLRELKEQWYEGCSVQLLLLLLLLRYRDTMTLKATTVA